MAMTCKPISFLRRITAWALEPTHPIMRAPFALEHWGMRWVVGSSREFAVALRLTQEPAAPLDARAVEQARLMLFPNIPSKGSAPGSSLAALKEWAGPVEWPAPEACPTCHGGEGHPSCTFCSGRGLVVPVHDARPGWMGDVLIDRAFLAWVLSPFDDENVAVCTRGPHGPVHVVGQSWIATVMPRADHAAQKDAPSLFMLAVPVASDVPKPGAPS